MAQSKSKLQGDAYVSFEGGVDSNLRPKLLQPNQLSWAANCVVRGGAVGPRPGLRKRTLTFASEDDRNNFQLATAHFQGAGYFRSVGDQSEIVCSIGGRLFAINPIQSYKVTDITPTDGRNSTYQDVVTFQQAEDWMIIQDGQSAPIIYNRAEARRSAALSDEVPTGAVSTYGNGRLWVGRFSEYAAGDLVGSSSGNPDLNRRDAVLKFTENDYLNEGGAFSTPSNAGGITAMQVMGSLDTALGDGELIVFTGNSAFATSVPTDRTQWKNLSYPVQRLVAPSGAVGPFTPLNVNGDLYFRSRDGIRSLIYARRDFGSPGVTPLSNEINRALQNESPTLLKHSSAVEFDNRLLHTCVSRKSSRGVIHKAIASMDFNPISGLRVKSPLAYDGIWAGLDFLHLVRGQFGQRDRCFAFAVNGTDIELWELDPNSTTDYNGTDELPIEWYIETRSTSFDSPYEMKRLDRFEAWLNNVRGQVDFTLYTRPDESLVWNQWATWSENAKTKFCNSDFANCISLTENRPSYRPRRSFGNPPNTSAKTDTKTPGNLGNTFQFRLKGVGYAQVDSMRFFAEVISEDIYPDRPTGTQTTDSGCPLTEYPEITL